MEYNFVPSLSRCGIISKILFVPFCVMSCVVNLNLKITSSTQETSNSFKEKQKNMLVICMLRRQNTSEKHVYFGSWFGRFQFEVFWIYLIGFWVEANLMQSSQCILTRNHREPREKKWFFKCLFLMTCLLQLALTFYSTTTAQKFI